MLTVDRARKLVTGIAILLAQMELAAVNDPSAIKQQAADAREMLDELKAGIFSPEEADDEEGKEPTDTGAVPAPAAGETAPTELNPPLASTEGAEYLSAGSVNGGTNPPLVEGNFTAGPVEEKPATDEATGPAEVGSETEQQEAAEQKES